MKRFNRVAVLKGGPSAERDVSLRSGEAVANGLVRAGYDAVTVDVADHDLDLPTDVDGVFIALHGEFGEDGGVQRLLDGLNLPYTGSGADASELAFDKKRSKEVFSSSAVPTPEYEARIRGDSRSLCQPTMSLPVVVKPSRQGSSIGVSQVFREDEWESSLADAFSHDNEVVVEEYIEGRELTVGIVGDEVFPPIEIVTPGSWYHYDSKYSSNRTEYLVPAPIDPSTSQECCDISRRAFKVLGCRGFGRVDLRLSADGRVYVLEVNTIPGFTETSLLPKAASAIGMKFSELCGRIMGMATVG